MIKEKIITLLIAVMCVSLISGSFTVICYGSDGHIAVEPILHNHCDCHKSEESSHQENYSDSSVAFESDHSHCKDTLVMSGIAISVRNKVKLQLVKILEQNLYQKLVSDHMTSSFRHPFLGDTELSSFFTPLETVILLA